MSSNFEPGGVAEVYEPPTPPSHMTDALAEVMQLLQPKGSRQAKEFLGVSEWSVRLIANVTRLSMALPDDIPITITGPSGTGKEIIARYFAKAGFPFVPINMAAIPEQLIHSILFGHTKGAFTGATETTNGAFIDAGRGTIFLDEIGDMPMALQPVLLRVLQERTVSRVGDAKTQIPIQCRIVCATNKDLADQTIFREDLHARLSMVEFKLLSIIDDLRIPDLYYIGQHFGFTKEEIDSFSGEVYSSLLKHNIRALQRLAIQKQYGI